MIRKPVIQKTRTASQAVRAFSRRSVLGVLALLLSLAFASSALAGPPAHLPSPTLDLVGAPPDPGPTHPAQPFNHACGTAVDSEGNVYVASAGNDAIDVFNPAHEYLTTITNENEPCGLAVNSKGELFVSEQASGNVVRYKPNAYPFSGTPTYGLDEPPIDSSGQAKGISVDPFDDRIYVAEGTHIAAYNPDGSFGIDEVQRILPFNATGGSYRLAMPGEGNAARNEIQRLGRDAQADGGTFTLTFDGETTGNIEFNASAAEVKAALEALSNIQPGDVSVSGFLAQSNRQYWWVEFTGALAKTDVPLIKGDGAGLTGFGNWSNEIAVQALSDISAPIPYEATHAEVQAALEGLESIGAGDVSVTEGAPAFGGLDHIVTFTGALADTDVATIVGDATGLVGGGSKQILVFELTKGFNGHIGEGDLTNATGVAPYTHLVFESPLEVRADRYVFVADDGATDQVKAFGGADIRGLKLRKTIAGVDHDRNPVTPEQKLGFGEEGAYLAVDPGNRNAEDKCTTIGEQACTAGHLLVYDDAHEAVDEFEASGQFLTQIPSQEPPFSFEDAQPTAIAVDRSGGTNDGTIYVTAGDAAGAKLLAFGPLVAPSRPPRAEDSFPQKNIGEVAVDRYGTRYVAVDSTIFAYGPTGKGPPIGIEGPKGEAGLVNQGNVESLAVDSACNVYAVDDSGDPAKVVYFAPVAPENCPPKAGSKYKAPVEIVPPGSFPGAVAVNPENDHVYVDAGKIMELGSAKDGSPPVDPNSEGKGGGFAAGLGLTNIQDIAVHGATGNVYVAGGFGGDTVWVIDPGEEENLDDEEILARITGAGSPSGPFSRPLGGVSAIAVDQSNGHVLVLQAQSGLAQEFEPSGAFVAQFGSFPGTNKPIASGIAIDNSGGPTDGNAYVAVNDSLSAFDPLTYGGPPIVVTGTASEVGEGGATLNGTVDPERVELTDCRFEHVTEAAFEATGFSDLSSGGSKPCVPGLAEIGKGDDPVPVHASLTGLEPEARYRFRLLAANKYGEDKGGPGLFGPPEITPLGALPILYDEATLRAEVDPSGLETEYRFEYGKGAGEYDQSTPVAKLAPGDGKVPVQANLTGLAEGTEYHFRILAENDAKALEGPDQTFTTLQRRSEDPCPNTEYRTGLSANLPDCRAYELVTPPDTRGMRPHAAGAGDAAVGFNNWLITPRGEGAGKSVAYFTSGTLPGFEGNGSLDGYRALRSEGLHPQEGWRSELFAPSFRETGGGATSPQGVAADQRYSLWSAPASEAFEGTLPPGDYLRTPGGVADSKCNPEPQQGLFELVGCGSLGTDPDANGRFLTPAGAHVIFSSEEPLEPAAPPAGTEALYDRAAGSASSQVLSLLPGGLTPGAGEDATYIAASENGAAVAFKLGGTLYVRRAGEDTVKVADHPNSFAGFSEDGERVFYATFDTPAVLPAELLAFELDTQTATPIAPNSIFVNVSADGSRAFFTSEKAFTGSEENENGEVAEEDEHNLYAWDVQTETVSFVALLDPQDFVSFDKDGSFRLDLWTKAITAGHDHFGRAFSPTRSTPDGEVLVFQSHAQLTPYDNTEASPAACELEAGGERCTEVYRYDAGEESILCVSCDPSGALPSADATLQSFEALSSPTHKTTLIPNVTDDGRMVFFDSFDSLLPEDANAVKDVYEWKAPGEGCKRAGGCLALISSGQGDRPSHLYGMSADGRDVFFRTLEKLHGQDIAGSSSIYDARVGGGIPDPPQPAPCQGDACQGQGSTPPALAPPASTGAGPGDFKDIRPRRCPKGKRKVRRNGKVRCVRRQGKKQHRKRSPGRANHNRGAQR